MMIEKVLIANHETGLPIYSRNLSDKVIDETLLLGFFSAIQTFGKSLLTQNSEINHIKIGDHLLDFDNEEFEGIGRVNILMVSTELDGTKTRAIIEEILEQFSIYLDEVPLEDNCTLNDLMMKGRFPNCRSFDPILEEIVSSVQEPHLFFMNMELAIPIDTINFIQSLYNHDPMLKDAFNNDKDILVEQIIHEFVEKGLRDAVEKRFKT